MNRKQLIVAWAIAILLSLVALFADYYRYSAPMQKIFTIEDLLKFGIPILICGGLLIYTLRDKK